MELGHALNKIEGIPVRLEARPDDLGWTAPHLQPLHVPHHLRHHLGDAGLPQRVPSPNPADRYYDRSFCGKVSCGLRVQNLESWTKSFTLPFGIHLSHDFTKNTNKGKYLLSTFPRFEITFPLRMMKVYQTTHSQRGSRFPGLSRSSPTSSTWQTSLSGSWCSPS